jgi:hypothetical protein
VLESAQAMMIKNAATATILGDMGVSFPGGGAGGVGNPVGEHIPRRGAATDSYRVPHRRGLAYKSSMRANCPMAIYLDGAPI